MTRICSFSSGYSIEALGRIWRAADWECRIRLPDGTSVPFSAASASSGPYRTGAGSGYRTVYRDFPGIPGLVLECRLWSEQATGDAIFEMIPLSDAPVQEILWPAPFENTDADAMTVLPLMQGCLLKNYTQEELPDIWGYYRGMPFEKGRYSCSRSMYMQFYGQYDSAGAVMTILETRYDGGMELQCGNGKPVLVGPRWRESLGKVGYARKLRVRFFPPGSDYNDLAKAYRAHIRSLGELVTLREKTAANPKVGDLIGRPIVHTYIWYHTAPGSMFYDREHPEANDRKQSFACVAEHLRRLRERGQEKAVLHLDGWGRRGYDNQHPDYLPPAEEPGGWEGMRKLQETCHELGYFFGLHDQYRDYFYDADTFDEEMAVHNADGGVTTHAVWMGGKQTFLCASQAPYYVRRNYDALYENGILPDNTYLDVFSCVELDECFHRGHRMTRGECAAYRLRCFREAGMRGTVIQSEEGVDWAFPGLAFIHHAPHASADFRPGEFYGIRIPLLDLVYHDCIVTPWGNSAGSAGAGMEEGSLLALLHGGTVYIGLDAGGEEIRKGKIIADWQKKVQTREMLRHEFVDGNPNRQRTWFEGGFSAEVDLENGTYELTEPGQGSRGTEGPAGAGY
ncbi:MAG: hypothetical protein II781_03475 [Clostridia bacterium]|nr:hypothetical protein [Clostridia bacterium]